jgi:hypothetical protein
MDIAYMIGYNSREGFSRAFKQHFGVSPSHYRRYNCVAYPQKSIQEVKQMPYSKAVEDIIRDINIFVVDAKRIAKEARQCKVQNMIPFWNLIADKTESLSDKIAKTVARIANLSKHHDEISNCFSIIQALEDIAYELNLIVLDTNLTVARNTRNGISQQESILSQYRELAKSSSVSTQNIVDFMKDLVKLIMSDLHRVAKEKIDFAIAVGKRTTAKIEGYEYIKSEIASITLALEIISPINITRTLIDDHLFRLHIISFAAETDLWQNPSDKAMFEGIDSFEDALSDVHEFFDSILGGEQVPETEQNEESFVSDVIYQVTTLRFYLCREIEKLTLSDMNLKSDELSKLIDMLREMTSISELPVLLDAIISIEASLNNAANSLNENGGAIKVLSDEFGRLSTAIRRRSNRDNGK